MRALSFLMEEPCRVNQWARWSRSSGWVGSAPVPPKSVTFIGADAIPVRAAPLPFPRVRRVAVQPVRVERTRRNRKKHGQIVRNRFAAHHDGSKSRRIAQNEIAMKRECRATLLRFLKRLE